MESTWEYNNCGEHSDGHEALKGIYFRAFLSGKQRIKFSPFKLQMNSFHNKISHIRHTSKIFSLGPPDKFYVNWCVLGAGKSNRVNVLLLIRC